MFESEPCLSQRNQEKRLWRNLEVRELSHSVVGVIGMGSIGLWLVDRRCRYGRYSHGLCVYSLHSYGLYSYGLHSYGVIEMGSIGLWFVD